jgi:hypothetical protein
MSIEPDRKVTAVIFDVGGILLDWNPRYLYRKLIPDPAPENRRARSKTLWLQYPVECMHIQLPVLSLNPPPLTRYAVKL